MTSPTAHPRLAIGLALLGRGCGSADEGSETRLDLDSLPELSVAELTAVGGYDAEGPHALGTVRAVALLAGGSTFAVADGSSQEIRVFGSDGRHVRTIGGRGGGSGEFRALRALWPHSDGGLCAWDIQESRSTDLSAELDVVEAHRADLDPVERILPGFAGFLPDCRYVLRDRREVMGMRDLLEEPQWFRNRDGSWGLDELVFGPSSMTVVAGEEVWVGSSARASFMRYRANGMVAGSVGLDVAPRPVTADEVEAAARDRLAVLELDAYDPPVVRLLRVESRSGV